MNTGIKILQLPDPRFRDLADISKLKRDDAYHPSVFVVRTDVPDGTLLFHTLTCELILLGKDRPALPEDQFLRDHFFAVPESLDEKALVRRCRELANNCEPSSIIPSSYTVLTTTDCNARCFYCYEMGRSRIRMTDDTALKVVEMMDRNYRRLQPSKRKDVNISWFGGEPLYNSGVIDLICGELKKRKVPFKTSMITNGYLFDAPMVRKAARKWKLRNVQITLDGTEPVYNRAKAYIYKEGESPFRRVVGNIGLLLDAGINVNVRLNVGRHNADDLLTLVRQLASRYGQRKGFACYPYPLFECAAGDRSVPLSDESRPLIYEALGRLEALMEQEGITNREVSLPKELRIHQCMADNGHSVVVAPTGELGLCEHYSESEFFSTVDSPEVVDVEMVAKFRRRRDEIGLCDRCPLYPQCIRLEMCEEAAVCNQEKVGFQLDRLRKAMVKVYDNERGASVRLDNETAERMYTLTQELGDEAAIVDRMMEEYDADEKLMRAEVKKFVSAMKRKGVLRR